MDSSKFWKDQVPIKNILIMTATSIATILYFG